MLKKMVIKKIVFCEKPYGRGIALNSPVLPGTFEGLETKNWQVIPLIMKACFSLTPQLGSHKFGKVCCSQ